MSKLIKERAYLLFSIYGNVENIRPQKLACIFGLLIVLVANLGHFAWVTLMWGPRLPCSSVDSWFPSLILNSVIVSGAVLCALAAGSSSSMQIKATATIRASWVWGLIAEGRRKRCAGSHFQITLSDKTTAVSFQFKTNLWRTKHEGGGCKEEENPVLGKWTCLEGFI